jgi:RHS repeat-associated protein
VERAHSLPPSQLSYEQSAPGNITDPYSGAQESTPGKLNLTQILTLGSDGSTAMRPNTFSYSQQTQYYEDGLLPPTPSSSAAFLYDGHGERIAQQTTSGGVTTTTVYVGDIEEVSSSGSTTTTTYYYANGKLIALGVNGQMSYLAADALGSATVAFGSNGTATASQLFAPYGVVRYSSGTMPTSFGFTGRRADTATGLDYLGSRYLDPVLGQFTSADTVLPGNGIDILGLSRYAYVEGNPENRTDPSGHCFCDVPGSGDNFFTQSGRRLLNGNTGDVYYGPSYSQSYHLASWTARPHHYLPYRPRRAPAPPTHHEPDIVGGTAGGLPITGPIAPTPQARANVGAAIVTWFYDHPEFDPTGVASLVHVIRDGPPEFDYSDPNLAIAVAMMADGGGGVRPGRAPESAGGQLAEAQAIGVAERWLGPGYREVSPGRYVSADGLRQVRYGPHEVSSATHHIHFETYDKRGGHVVENTRATIVP